MSELTDHDGLRGLLRELGKVQLESERIRVLVSKIRNSNLECEERPGVSGPFTDATYTSEKNPS